jgi:CheY-like chemotaxis protein
MNVIQTMEELVRKLRESSSIPKILIVEDDVSYASLIRTWFEDLPYELEFAYSGEDAVERLSTKAFNLLWVDLKLPGLSGVDVIRHAKEVPAIVVKGYPNTDLAKEAHGLGVILVYGKPDNLQELKRFLNTFNLKPS